MTTTYKNASYVMAGIACLITTCSIIVHYTTNGLTYEEYNAVWDWISPFLSLATPILFGWIGILLRKKYPTPKTWVKVLLLLLFPALYLVWTVLHGHGIVYFQDGTRCMWLYCAILGYLISVERLEGYAKETGWLELALFIASAFVYCGVCRVVNHFSVISFQMLDTPWIRLFHRAMRFVPLAMAVFFLAEFSFSRTGQALGGFKAVQVIVKILVVLSFLVTLDWCFRWRFYRMRLYVLGKVISQPVIVNVISWAYWKFQKTKQ